MTTRIEQIRARLPITEQPDTKDLLRLAEAAERWEEAKWDEKEISNRMPYPSWSADMATAFAQLQRTSLDLVEAVRAFREGGGEG